MIKEIRAWIERNQQGASDAEEWARALVEALGENERLRAALDKSSVERKIDRAFQDAQLIATMACSGMLYGRRAVTGATAMSERQYDHAVALLRMGRVYNGGQLVVDDLAHVVRRLEGARRRAVADPESWWQYHTRVNRGATGPLAGSWVGAAAGDD